MVELAVIGTDEFVTGFQLAGVKEIIVADEQPVEQVRKLRQSGGTGIVIIDEDTLGKLDVYEREDVEDSVSPVFIAVSEKAEDEGLRKMIIKSIGVDLWGR